MRTSLAPGKRRVMVVRVALRARCNLGLRDVFSSQRPALCIRRKALRAVPMFAAELPACRPPEQRAGGIGVADIATRVLP